jgi:hypothetical protein
VCLIDDPLFPFRVNSRCRAIMFAIKRNASVPGRIRLLIVSIITMNSISMVGVPWGTKCSNIHRVRKRLYPFFYKRLFDAGMDGNGLSPRYLPCHEGCPY